MKLFNKNSENEIVTFLKWDNLRLEETIQRVRELHNNNVHSDYCSHCSNCFMDERHGLTFHSTPKKYPCPTIKALDGEQ